MHAFVGENGAGKTTLMRILYGAIASSGGEVSMDGRPIRFANTEEAIRAGVGMVSQHYAIIPELTQLQNLVLGAEGSAVMDRRAMTARADELAQKMGFRFDWDRPAAGVSPAQAQKLEILKLLWREARIMILDEPTAMLSPEDGKALFASLRALVSEGRTVLLVTHRIAEVLDHCERVTVLRAGRQVADLPVGETDGSSLARLIVGGDVLEGSGRTATPTGGGTILELKGLRVRGERGEEAVKGIDLTVRAGEIVGIAGVDGSGQRELVRAVLGHAPVLGGSIQLGGADLSRRAPARRLADGLRLIPEDRHAEGLVDEWDLLDNAVLGLQRSPRFARAGRRTWAERVAERFATRHPGLGSPAASLSGGNQQRFVAARALLSDPKMVLAFQPARGLDLNATTSVYRGLREAVEGGAGVLVVSFDLDELLTHCDRIVVMNGGVLRESPGRDREAVGRLMTGAAA